MLRGYDAILVRSWHHRRGPRLRPSAPTGPAPAFVTVAASYRRSRPTAAARPGRGYNGPPAVPMLAAGGDEWPRVRSPPSPQTPQPPSGLKPPKRKLINHGGIGGLPSGPAALRLRTAQLAPCRVRGGRRRLPAACAARLRLASFVRPAPWGPGERAGGPRPARRRGARLRTPSFGARKGPPMGAAVSGPGRFLIASRWSA